MFVLLCGVACWLCIVIVLGCVLCVPFVACVCGVVLVLWLCCYLWFVLWFVVWCSVLHVLCCVCFGLLSAGLLVCGLVRLCLFCLVLVCFVCDVAWRGVCSVLFCSVLFSSGRFVLLCDSLFYCIVV